MRYYYHNGLEVYTLQVSVYLLHAHRNTLKIRCIDIDFLNVCLINQISSQSMNIKYNTTLFKKKQRTNRIHISG